MELAVPPSNAHRAAKGHRSAKVMYFTVPQASAITGVPRKLVDQYLDRELHQLSANGARFKAVRKDGLLALRLNYDYAGLFKERLRLDVIRQAAVTRNKYVSVSGLMVPIDVARSTVNAGLARFRAAMSLVTINEEVLSGEPCIRGRRMSVYVVHGLHDAGGREEVKDSYSDLSDREIEAAIMYADMFPRMGRPRSVESRLSRTTPTRSRVKRVSANG
jgi:uncharacterized protein (DUF433 family)